MRAILRAACAASIAAGVVVAQVYTPKVLMKGQVDSTDLHSLAEGIVRQAHATTPRQKAEAIWRFFLTDGRFAFPGFWYHLGGWSYEEPKGEVLDVMKMLNSYGFGLCYQIAPLLQAVYHAAGFEDARVWFLTGHTVTEVFYDGAYHYFDSDMMGYTPVGKGKLKELPVASVAEIAADPQLVLGKVKGPRTDVDDPWYPADVREGAMPELISVFSSTKDNWLFPFQRYAEGHSMEFVLRPGERMTRYYGAEAGSFYLPYRWTGQGWEEVPQDSEEFNVQVKNGPRAPHDKRDWGTGRLEYRPPLDRRDSYLALNGLKLPRAGEAAGLTVAGPARSGEAIFEVLSPYVLMGAEFSLNADLREGAQLSLETSTDNGSNWQTAGELKGPHQGAWNVAAAEVTRSAHGALNAVAGAYGYLLRLRLNAAADGASVKDVQLLTRFEFNMRMMAPLRKGRNEFAYEPGRLEMRRELPVRLDRLAKTAFRMTGMHYVTEADEGVLLAREGEDGEMIYELSAPDGTPISGISAGGRFLDLRNGLAPEKRTAEVRETKLATEKAAGAPYGASLEWSLSPEGPYTTLWTYDPKVEWRDGKPVEQLLRWPEVDRSVSLPAGVSKAYVRYRLRNMALDDVRLAVTSPRSRTTSPLEVIHVWFENDQERSHVERIDDPTARHEYSVSVSSAKLKNYALIYRCPAPGESKP